MPRGAIKKEPPAHEYTSYEDAFPASEGPPALHLLGHISPDTPIALIFRAEDYLLVWETVEEMARRRWDTRKSTASGAGYVRAVKELRAVWNRRGEAETPPQAPGDENPPGVRSRTPSPAA
jgi:hypothetical protein